MWTVLALFSALLLGFYDVCKKHALRENAVLPVLFFATFFGFLVALPFLILSLWMPEFLLSWAIVIPVPNKEEHIRIILKSALVSSSWILAYFAMKNLPLSTVSPIRASAPLFTLLGAVLIFGESPTALQWVGLALVFASHYGLSLAGKKEGLHFVSNQWIYCLIGATLLGATSGLYDKYLLHFLHYSPLMIQVWFCFYLVLILGLVVLLAWFPQRKKHTPFRWKKSIPMIGIFLLCSDTLYFFAVHHPDALISLISALRRSCVLVSFFAAYIIFKESHFRYKIGPVIGILIGITLILLKF